MACVAGDMLVIKSSLKKKKINSPLKEIYQKKSYLYTSEFYKKQLNNA